MALPVPGGLSGGLPGCQDASQEGCQAVRGLTECRGPLWVSVRKGGQVPLVYVSMNP